MYIGFRYIRIGNWTSFWSKIKSRRTKIRTMTVILFNKGSLAQDYRYFTHHRGVIIGAMASQITGVSIVCSTVCSDADQRKQQSSASLAFVRGIHRWPVNSPHKRPVTRKMVSFDDVIMRTTFQMHFLTNKLWYLNSHCTAVCSCTISLFLYIHHWNTKPLCVKSTILFSRLFLCVCRFIYLSCTVQ